MVRLFSFLILALAVGAAPALGSQTDGASQRRYNVRVSPIDLLGGVLNADLDIGVGRRVTLGPEMWLVSRNYSDVHYYGGALGVRANFYLGHDRFTDSWIIGPFLDFMSLNLSQTGYNTLKQSGSALGTAIAYQWVWKSGFNLDLGGTVGVYDFPATVTLTDNSGNSTSLSTPYGAGFFGFEFTIGYAF